MKSCSLTHTYAHSISWEIPLYPKCMHDFKIVRTQRIRDLTEFQRNRFSNRLSHETIIIGVSIECSSIECRRSLCRSTGFSAKVIIESSAIINLFISFLFYCHFYLTKLNVWWRRVWVCKVWLDCCGSIANGKFSERWQSNVRTGDCLLDAIVAKCWFDANELRIFVKMWTTVTKSEWLE